MEAFIKSGEIVELMLGFVALEILLLLGLRWWRGFGIPPLALLLNIGAGTSLMLALGAELKGFDWTIIAAFLLSALFFHLADLGYRFSVEK